MCLATAAARPTGTALPICLAISILLPHQTKSSGKSCSRAASQVRDRPGSPGAAVRVPLRVQVLTLLGLEELGADGQRRRVPPHTAHDVGRAGLLLPPAAGQQVVRHVEAASTGRHVVVAPRRARRGLRPKCRSLLLKIPGIWPKIRSSGSAARWSPGAPGALDPAPHCLPGRKPSFPASLAWVGSGCGILPTREPITIVRGRR